MKKKCDVSDWDFTLKIFKHLEKALKSFVKELEKERNERNSSNKQGD